MAARPALFIVPIFKDLYNIPDLDRESPLSSSSFPTLTQRHPRLRPGISLTQTLGHAKMQCARCVPFPCALRSFLGTLRARKTQIYALYRLFVCLKVWNAILNPVRHPRPHPLSPLSSVIPGSDRESPIHRHGRPDRPSPATPSVILRPHPSSPLSSVIPGSDRGSPLSSSSSPASTGDLRSRPRHS